MIRPRITLNPQQIKEAARVGVCRVMEVISRDLKNMYGEDFGTLWQNHIEGACGEKAVSIYTQIPWDPAIGNTDPEIPDVGPYQVRTAFGSGKRLIVHDRDPSDQQYILVLGIAGRYTIMGWNYGYELKKLEYWEDPTKRGRFAYFGPQSILRPIDTLGRENGVKYASL